MATAAAVKALVLEAMAKTVLPSTGSGYQLTQDESGRQHDLPLMYDGDGQAGDIPGDA
jgi:hypothetical protein